VRNPDGKLVTHREFENSLAGGQVTLALLLGRAITMGLWSVLVSGNLCLDSTHQNAPIDCFVVETAYPPNLPSFFARTLMLNVDQSVGTLTLSGTFTVQNSGQISTLTTENTTCAASVAPSSCLNVSTIGGFTLAGITPINVTVGQLVQVSVLFSFS